MSQPDNNPDFPSVGDDDAIDFHPPPQNINDSGDQYSGDAELMDLVENIDQSNQPGESQPQQQQPQNEEEAKEN